METNIRDENITSSQQFDTAIKKNDNTFVRIHAEWCGHCKNLKPEWEKLVDMVHSDDKLKNKIHLISIDSANLDSDKLKKTREQLNVQGFPTIIFIKDGDISNKKESNDRTADDMLTYIKNNIEQETRAMSGGGKRRIMSRIKGKKTRKTNKRSKSGLSLRKRTKSRAGRGKSRSRQRSKSRN